MTIDGSRQPETDRNAVGSLFPAARSAPLTAEERAALAFVTERLVRVADGSMRFVFTSIKPPKPDSRIDRATKADLRDAYDFAGHLIHAAEDHLGAILSIIKSRRLPSYALYSLLRPAAEAEVRAKHLLDPSMSESERLGRGMNERLDNIDEQKKAGVDAAEIQERISHLEERATANGIEIMKSNPKKAGQEPETIGFREVAKEAYEFFMLYMREGSIVYRLLGAHIHSKPWMQLQKDRVESVEGDPVLSIPTDINVMVFASVLDSVLILHDENIGNLLRLAGYPELVWSEYKSRPVSLDDPNGEATSVGG
jgi:hypothetical protein